MNLMYKWILSSLLFSFVTGVSFPVMCQDGKPQAFTKQMGTVIDGGKPMNCSCYRLTSPEGDVILEQYFCSSNSIEPCRNGEGDYCVLTLRGPGCSRQPLLEERVFQVVSPMIYEGRELILDPKLFPPPKVDPKRVPPMSLLNKLLWRSLMGLSSLIHEAEAQTGNDALANTLQPADAFGDTLPPLGAAPMPVPAGGAFAPGALAGKTEFTNRVRAMLGNLIPTDTAIDLQDSVRERITSLAKYIEEHPDQKDALAEVASNLGKTDRALSDFLPLRRQLEKVLRDLEIGNTTVGAAKEELAKIESGRTMIEYSNALETSDGFAARYPLKTVIKLPISLARAARDPSSIQVTPFEGSSVDPQTVSQTQRTASQIAKDRLLSGLYQAVDQLEETPVDSPGISMGGFKSAKQMDEWVYRELFQKNNAGNVLRTGQVSALNPQSASELLKKLDLKDVKSISVVPGGESPGGGTGAGFESLKTVLFERDSPGAEPASNDLGVWARRSDSMTELGQAALKGDRYATEKGLVEQAERIYGIDLKNRAPDIPSGNGKLPGLNSPGVTQTLEEIGEEVASGTRTAIKGSRSLFTTLNMRGGALVLAIVPPLLIIAEIGTMAGTIIDHALEERWGERMTDWVHEKLSNEKILTSRPRSKDLVTTTCLTPSCNVTKYCDSTGKCWTETYFPCASGTCMSHDVVAPASPGGTSGAGAGGTPSGTPGGNTGGSVPGGAGTAGGGTQGGGIPGVGGTAGSGSPIGGTQSGGQFTGSGHGQVSSPDACPSNCHIDGIDTGPIPSECFGELSDSPQCQPPGGVFPGGGYICDCDNTCELTPTAILVPKPKTGETLALKIVRWSPSKINDGITTMFKKSSNTSTPPPYALALTDGCSSDSGSVGSGGPTPGVGGGSGIGSVGGGPLVGNWVVSSEWQSCTCHIDCVSGIRRPINTPQNPTAPNVMYVTVTGKNCQAHCPGDPANFETVGDVDCH